MGRKLTTAEFIAKAIEVHGHRYDYSLVEYTSAKDKVPIKCPFHGVFCMTPNNHTHKKHKQGCPACAKRFMTTEEFIQKAKAVHGDIYDYSKTQYISSDTRVTIICPVHNEFTKIPYNHISSKQGCPECSKPSKIGNRPKLSTDDFIDKATTAHGDKYIYSSVVYKDSKTKVEILCPSHGTFWVTPNNHFRGRGCPSCATSGYDKTKPAILYYLSIDNGQAFKIGTTNRTVQSRFSAKDSTRITELFQIHLPGNEAYDIEQQILDRFKEYVYTKEALLESGNTELFSANIFKDCPDLLTEENKLTILQNYLKDYYDTTILLGNP